MNKTLFAACFVVFVMGSCSKDELTKPATVTCEFYAQTDDVMEGNLTIERLNLNLSEIDISGRRTGDDDMFFTRRFNAENGYFILSDVNTTSTVLQIPQGTYETLVFYTTLREEEYEFEYGTSGGDDDETSDLAEYIENARPGILLIGRYVNGAENFPVVIALNDDIRRLALDATQSGLPTVTLEKGVPALGTVTFDVSYWFTSITAAMMESAVKFPLNGEGAVVISEDYNELIHDQIAGRIEASVTLTIEDQ
jgi:hypothetical protein